MTDLKIAVITGGHHFNVMAFTQMFRELPGIDAYLQHVGDFVASTRDLRASYDALVFYTHLKGEVAEIGSSPGEADTVQSALELLGHTPQGLVLLHHSLLAFPQWDIWNTITGMPDRTLTEYAHDEAIEMHIVDPEHPVTAGLSDWTLTDETYLMPDAGADNHILITTTHPRSTKTLGWVRQHKQSRVVCLQSGHDEQTWRDANFRTLLAQAIRWSVESL